MIEFVGLTTDYYGQCIDDVQISGFEPYPHNEVVTVTADNVTITGFTIQNSGTGYMDYGLDINSDYS